MEMTIDFPGGARVDAHFEGHTLYTDQPTDGGGTDSAPTPFELFQASIGTCVGIYVLGFCRQRELPTAGIHILQRSVANPATGLLDRLEIEIQVPPDFPKPYYTALVRAAELCKVKKSLATPPAFEIVAREVAVPNAAPR